MIRVAEVRVVDVRQLRADRVFDVVDVFARDRRVSGPRPGPLAPVRFFVVARVVGGARQPFDPPKELSVSRSPSGYFLFYGKQRLASGERVAARLDPGTYVIRVEGGPYQRVEVDVPFPAPPPPPPPGPPPPGFVEFALPPGPTYPFPRTSTVPAKAGPTLLRGSLRRMDGVSVEGTVVGVPGLSVYDDRMDETGEWVLFFPDDQGDQQVTVRFVHPDGSVEQVAGVDIRQGKENTLRQTVLRGWVLTQGGAPIPGARVRVGGRPGEAVTDVAGAWFFYFGFALIPPGAVTVTAVHPDGRSVSRSGVQLQPQRTVSIDPFRFP